MRILYLDIDTLRADHLGCYGYLRNTSPNIDAVARRGVRLENCYASDAPCLPSRASMFTGRFGIHTGVVNHGGLAADLRHIGRQRGFNWMRQRPGLIWSLRQLGYWPVSISPFAERHSAWWFCDGWREMVNTGRGGMESADEVVPHALDWLARNARRDDWLLHVNLWDPHTPYRAPDSLGNPFGDDPIEDWYTEELRQRQWSLFGPGGPQEPAGNYGRPPGPAGSPGSPGSLRSLRQPGSLRQPDQIGSMADYRQWIDGYDCGIRYADEWIGRILNALADQGVMDETAILITSDHGENMGELGVIGDHAVADHITSRVPVILCWPGLAGQGGRADAALHYQTDVAATILELAGGRTPEHWDGRSFAEALRAGRPDGRRCIVVSQCCWSCMRSVRWDDWLFVRTYHTGLKRLPARMLFNIADDPHELNDLAEGEHALADRGSALLEEWTAAMMTASEAAEDPLWTVMREGGPFHTRGRLAEYCQRLRDTGRAHHADFLEKHPTGLAGE